MAASSSPPRATRTRSGHFPRRAGRASARHRRPARSSLPPCGTSARACSATPSHQRRSLVRKRRTEEAFMELEGKVALVTGASGGIGAAVARRFHDAGASVGLLSRRGDDLGLERGLGVLCDVRSRSAVRAATEAVVEHFDRLDIAVANAGVGAYGDFLDL